MAKRKLALLIFLINSVLLFPSFKVCAEYNPQTAVTYADDWWGNANINWYNNWKIYNCWLNDGENDARPPNAHADPYYNHYVRLVYNSETDEWNWLTDCAYFVSQCLIAGGLEDDIRAGILNNRIMTQNERDQGYAGSKYTQTNPATSNAADAIKKLNYISDGNANTRNKAIVNVKNLNQFLIKRIHAQYIKGIAPRNLVAGDVFTRYGDGEHHAMIIISGTYTNAIFAAHTTDTHTGNIPAIYRNYHHFFHMVPSVPHVKSVNINQTVNNQSRSVYYANWIDNETSHTRALLPANHQERNIIPATKESNPQIAIEFNESIWDPAEFNRVTDHPDARDWGRSSNNQLTHLSAIFLC